MRLNSQTKFRFRNFILLHLLVVVFFFQLDAQTDLSKLDVLVCGNCHEVYHFVEELQQHKAADDCQYQSSSAVKDICENEVKPQVWGFTLWKNKQMKKKEETPATLASWPIYQRWCKLEQTEKDLWIAAGQCLQTFNKISTAKLQEMKVKQEEVLSLLLLLILLFNYLFGYFYRKSRLIHWRRRMTLLRQLIKLNQQQLQLLLQMVSSIYYNKLATLINLFTAVPLAAASVSEATVESASVQLAAVDNNDVVDAIVGKEQQIVTLALDDEVAELIKAGTIKPLKISALPATKMALKSNEKDKKRDEFSVEKILAKRYNPKRKTWEYEVKWENYVEETWEPLAHLSNCKEMVDQFEEKVKTEKEKILTPAPRGRGRPRLSALAVTTPRSSTSSVTSSTQAKKSNTSISQASILLSTPEGG